MDSFLAKALLALPEIATSPLAMVAYLATIGAYIFVALRVRRHRNLLQHLTALPEEDRIRALEAELGGAKLRTGITAEEWLRSRIHHYVYLAFLATCITVIIIVSLILYRTSGSVDMDVTGYSEESIPEQAVQNLPRLIPSSASAVGLEFSVPGGPKEGRGVDGHYFEGYRYKKEDGKLLIYPSSSYLDAINNEEEVAGGGLGGGFPVLSVKVVNNTDKTLLISEVRIDVLSSIVDKRPVIVVKSGTYSSRLVFMNEGWGGEVRSPRLAVIMNGSSCNKTHISSHADFPVESFDAMQSVDLSSYVGAQLKRELLTCTDEIYQVCMRGRCVDTRRKTLQCTEPFDGSETCESVDNPVSAEAQQLLEKVRGSPLDSLTYMRECHQHPMCVKGTLSFSDERGRDHKFRFETKVFPGDEPKQGPASPAPPSQIYDIFLEAGKSGYTVTRDLSQGVRPGEADHFLLQIATDRSSNFQLKVTIKNTRGDETWSGHVDMTAFVPRSLSAEWYFDALRRGQNPYNRPRDKSPEARKGPLVFSGSFNSPIEDTSASRANGNAVNEKRQQKR